MESPESTLHCSFVVYLDQDAEVLPRFLTDLHTFFQKFPLHYELVVALEKNASRCAELLQKEQQKTPTASLRILRNSSFKGRAESLRQALNTCETPFLLILNPEMSSPLGDSFKILQNLMSEADLDLCWGERYSKNMGLIKKRATPRLSLEDIFNKILQEKNRSSNQDHLCEIGGLKLLTWKKINTSLNKSVSGWYLHVHITKAASALSLKQESIFIHDSGTSAPSFSLWKARWNLLRQSIF